MSLKNLGDVSYFRLNNEINRPINGQIPLHKDREALEAFFRENVIPNTMAFDSITAKIRYLIDNDYIEAAFIGKYTPDRKSTRLNSSHVSLSYAVFCLK